MLLGTALEVVAEAHSVVAGAAVTMAAVKRQTLMRCWDIIVFQVFQVAQETEGSDDELSQRSIAR